MCGEHLSKCAINMKMRLEIPVVEGRQAREKHAQKKNIFSNRSQRNSLGVKKQPTSKWHSGIYASPHLPADLVGTWGNPTQTNPLGIIWYATWLKWFHSHPGPSHINQKKHCAGIVPCVPLLCKLLDHVCRLCCLKLMIRSIIFMGSSPNSCWLKSVVLICLISHFFVPSILAG